MGGERTPEAVRDHRREWADCRYVYPVISRRARGLSIGVNLNPDRRCTFACLYCQVDRLRPASALPVDVAVLAVELDRVVGEVVAGRLWESARFRATPPAWRRLNDIAFSGDGEPTCCEQFDAAVRVAADVKRARGLRGVKLVVITNATGFGTPAFRRALPVLDAGDGEIWAKLDAGTEAWFQRVNRPRPGLSLAAVTADIASVARDRPVVIQTLFFRLDGAPPPRTEIEAYAARLRGLREAGARLKSIQLLTVARPPASSAVSALSEGELEALAREVRVALPGLVVDVFAGAPPEVYGEAGE